MLKYHEINDDKIEVEKMVTLFFFFSSFSLLFLFILSFLELIRLMNTATNETRKAIIRESLNILDSPRKKNIGIKKNGTNGILNQHVNVFETEKVRESNR